MDSRRARILALTLRAIIGGSLIAPLAHAQQLNLSPRYSPKPNDGTAVPALAQRLRSRANDLEAPPGIDPRQQPRRAILHDLTLLARDLLLRGESLGVEGSMLVLAGHTLAEDLPALEAWLGPERFDDATAIAIALDLRAAPDDDANKLPTEPQPLFRMLRDRLAPLVVASPPPHSAWWISPSRAGPAGNAPTFGSLADGLNLRDEQRARAVALDSLLADARSHPSFTSSAESLDRSLTDAAPLLLSPPAWLTRSSQPIEKELTAAIDELSNSDTSAAGQLRLRRLALISRTASQIASLRDSPASRKLIEVLTRSVAALPATVLPGELARWRSLTEALADADTPPVLRADLDRNLRPALPTLTAAADESRLALLTALPRLMAPDATTTEPSLISARAAHQRRLADIEMLSDLSPAIAEQPPAPGARRTPDPMATIRTRVLKLSQDLTKATLRDVALAELRDLASGLAPNHRSTLPRELFDDAASRSLTHQVLGDQRRLLLDLAASERQAWITQTGSLLLARKPAAPLPTDFMDAVETYIVARASIDPRALARLNHWPAFRLSPAHASLLTGSLRDTLEPCERALIEQRADQFVAAARGLRSQGQALWIGTLALGVPADTRSSDLPVALAKLALGSPDPEAAWHIEHAEQVALVCRYADELAALNTRNDRHRDLNAYLVARSRALLATLQASVP